MAKDTQATERPIPRPRRKLFDFPCHYAELDLSTGEPSSHCWHIRRGDCASAQHCLSLPIYREYLALAKCARLLGIFERKCQDDMLLATWDISAFYQGPHKHTSRFWRMKALIRSALDKAGL